MRPPREGAKGRRACCSRGARDAQLGEDLVHHGFRDAKARGELGEVHGFFAFEDVVCAHDVGRDGERACAAVLVQRHAGLVEERGASGLADVLLGGGEDAAQLVVVHAFEGGVIEEEESEVVVLVGDEDAVRIHREEGDAGEGFPGGHGGRAARLRMKPAEPSARPQHARAPKKRAHTRASSPPRRIPVRERNVSAAPAVARGNWEACRARQSMSPTFAWRATCLVEHASKLIRKAGRPGLVDESIVQEGRASLVLPRAYAEGSTRGPGARPRRGVPEAEKGVVDAPPPQVFYNPAMALNRDLSSLLVATRARDGWHVLDGLAASGARGLRYALESGARLQVEWNDWNPLAVKLIERNCERNGVEPHVTCRNLAPLLHESVWDVVDVDPYGSPAPFLDAATRAVRDGGVLGLTATDATALAGVYPNVCRRRYFASPLHGELGHEVALRILAASAVRHAARHDLALTPILAHATDHYYRVTLACRRGASRADKALASVGVMFLCPTCGDRGFGDSERCPTCGAPVRSAGPVWTGQLGDAATTEAMLARADGFAFASPASRPLLEILAEEAHGPIVPFDLHEAGSRLKRGSPRTRDVVAKLAELGYRVAPVHHERLAIRTDAPSKVVHDVVAEAGGA